MAINFEWKRFWYPRGESVDLSDGGFLPDPDGEWTGHLNPDLVSSESVAELECVALLGEPGIGKSYDLECQRLRAESFAQAAGGKVVKLDLRSFGDEGRLQRALFESEKFEAWRRSDYILHLFLDSLDECLLRIDNVASLLADELPEQPVERLRLHIACRPTPWPEVLESALTRLFPQFQAFEMAPLQRKDVSYAAERSGIQDVRTFLDRVEALNAAPLAVKPITLRFLISTYLQEEDFPTDPIKLYEKGCRILCEEVNESRRGAGRTGRLSAEERLVTAARLAAITQFANRDAVYTGPETEGASLEDVSIAEVAGGVERGQDEVKVSHEAVREVLDSGLFSSKGPNRLGWAHQTYAEFLAALYCIRHQMPLGQLQSLIFHPANQGDRLVPQLRELAVWVSAMNPQIFEAVAKSEPEVLLGAAPTALSGDQRKLLVQTILDQCVGGRTLHLRWDLRRRYDRLNYPGLAEQLRTYLREKDLPIGARHVAVDIAWAAGVEELTLDLAEMALDAEENRSLRIACAAATAAIASADIRGRLAPLALGASGPDPDDELKGSGLKAIWRDFIGIEDVLAVVTPPKQPGLHGTYKTFLNNDFLQKTVPADIPSLLGWFSKQKRHEGLGAIDRLMDEIIRLGWKNLDREGVAAALAEAVVSRMRLNDTLMSSSDREMARALQQDEERRRTLLSELIPRVTASQVRVMAIVGTPLLAAADFDWLLDRLLSGEFPGSASTEASLVSFVFDWRCTPEVERLYAACQANDVLRAECGTFFGPMELDSPLAKSLRENLEQEKTLAQPKLLDPPPSELVAERIARFEKGELTEWVDLVFHLTLKPTSQRFEMPGPDLTTLPGWQCADASTRNRIVSAALRYVNEGDPQNETWVGTSTVPYAAETGYHALALLLTVAQAKLKTVGANIWAKWVPVLLWGRCSQGDTLQFRTRLLKRAYAVVPSEVRASIERVIDSENERRGYFLVADEIETCWDDQMGSWLLAKARDPKLKVGVFAGLLGLLAQRGVPGWLDLAESFISPSKLEAPGERGRALGACKALLVNASDASWSTVWPILRDHNNFGRELVESLCYGMAGELPFVDKLTESQVGELYIWMVRNYPFAERRSGAMGPADMASFFRDSLLEGLKKRCNFAACDAIRGIMAKFPEHGWLGYHMEEAELLARAATWQPIAPREFVELAMDSSRLFVETPDQLVLAILASLDRLQSELHGEQPSAKYLWDRFSGGFRPKTEPDLSDYISIHLRRDLIQRRIVVNREVQIRPIIGSGTGQLTDIHVDTLIPERPSGSYEQAYVIMEVKGNWHAELLTAMETQLRDRYLKDNACRHGIYLVGWFSCDRWDGADRRKKRCPKFSLGEARRFFSRQATELSEGGYHITSYVLDVTLP